MGIFADYEYEKMPELEDAEKVTVESIANKPGIITFAKGVDTRDGRRMFVRFALDDGSDVFIYTGAVKIVSTLDRMMSVFDGKIPEAKVMVAPYPTKNGTGFKLTDAE